MKKKSTGGKIQFSGAIKALGRGNASAEMLKCDGAFFIMPPVVKWVVLFKNFQDGCFEVFRISPARPHPK